MKLSSSTLLRTPLLPVSCINADPLELFKSNSAVREAIYLSSTSLYSKVIDLITKGVDSKKEEKKILVSLKKCVIRMSYRCTPFGMNAGVSSIKLNDSTTKSITLGSSPLYQKHIRIDMGFLGEIYKILLESPLVREMVLYANNTLYKVHNEFRFYDYKYSPGRVHNLAGISWQRILDDIVSKTRRGMLFGDLKMFLLNKNYESADADQFLLDLIDSKFLVTELEPGVCGTHFQMLLKNFLEKQKNELPEEIMKLLPMFDFNNQHIGNTEKYIEFRKNLENYNFLSDDFFQVDLHKPVEDCSLGKGSFENLTEAIKILQYLNFNYDYPGAEGIEKFSKEFNKRYEGREMPLCLALDPDVGIGYPADSEVVEETSIAEGLQPFREQFKTFIQPERFNIIVKKYTDCLVSGNGVLFLKESEFEDILRDTVIKPPSVLSSLITVYENGNDIIINHVGTDRMGLKVAARFSYMNNSYFELSQGLEDLSISETDEIINPEINFLPEDRAGNITFKPLLSKWELPIITPGCSKNVIDIADLTIRIDGGKVIVRDPKNDIIVRPKYTSAYAYNKSTVPLFRFFGDLAFQELKGHLSWMWGALDSMPFLPRVQYKNIVLAPARWTVNMISFQNVINERKNFINRWTNEKMPTRFCIVQSDHLMPIDLESEASYELYKDEAQKVKVITIQEDLTMLGNSIVSGPEGEFANEFVLFWDNEKVPTTSIKLSNKKFTTIKTIPSGQGWIYYKIYCGIRMADKLLCNYLIPQLNQMIKTNIIGKWFFVRYGDPDFHVRLRIACPPENNEKVRRLLDEIYQKLLAQNLIWKIQEDVYERELERYGEKSIEHVETLFFNDSLFFSQVFRKSTFSQAISMRWKFALLSIDQLLNDFKFANVKKLDLMRRVQANMFAEFGLLKTKSNTDILSKKFRSFREEINLAMSGKDPELNKFYHALAVRGKNNKRVISAIIEDVACADSYDLVDKLVLSLIHMSANRFLMIDQRLQETVIYDLLVQTYKSQVYFEKEKKNDGIEVNAII